MWDDEVSVGFICACVGFVLVVLFMIGGVVHFTEPNCTAGLAANYSPQGWACLPAREFKHVH